MGMSTRLGSPSALAVGKATATIILAWPPAHTLASMTRLQARIKSADTFPDRKVSLPSERGQLAS